MDQLCIVLDIHALSNILAGDSYKTVLNTYNNKKQNIQRLKTQLEVIEKETQAQMQEIENTNTQLNVGRIPKKTVKYFHEYSCSTPDVKHSGILHCSKTIFAGIEQQIVRNSGRKSKITESIPRKAARMD